MRARRELRGDIAMNTTKNVGTGKESRWIKWGAAGLSCLALATGCSSGESGSEPSPADTATEGLSAKIGPAGGELVGEVGSALEGVRLVIPAGALDKDTAISIHSAKSDTALPPAARACGPEFAIEPRGLELAAPATLTLPVDAAKVAEQDRFFDETKVWALDGDHWGQRTQIDGDEGQVTVELMKLDGVVPGVNPPDEKDLVRFDLRPNPKFVGCLAQYPSDPKRQPTMHVDVVRGKLNDGMFLHGRYIKPELAFDLFTVENSQLAADGTVDPAFKNFGLAWYQSDLEADDHGEVRAAIRTILLDQIFGFDPKVGLPPTGTFQVGFWFNDPNDAAACGFDVNQPTPFNGEHKAGPMAMISVPDVETGLGPLCTKPDTSVSPARCDP
jgi:hypothetical protein